MLRPLWLSLPPPSTVREFEEFKLPRLLTLLEAHDETAVQKGDRQRQVRREAFRFYRAVEDQLGEEAAKALFGVFISNPRRGSPGGSSDVEIDKELLAAYHRRRQNLLRFKSKGARHVVARAAADVALMRGKKPASLQRKLSRLLEKQERDAAQQKRRQTTWENRRRPFPLPPPLMGLLATDNSDENSED